MRRKLSSRRGVCRGRCAYPHYCVGKIAKRSSARRGTQLPWQAGRAFSVMDRKNIRAMVNLTGGYDDGLVEVITKYDKAFPGRFYSLTDLAIRDSWSPIIHAFRRMPLS